MRDSSTGTTPMHPPVGHNRRAAQRSVPRDWLVAFQRLSIRMCARRRSWVRCAAVSRLLNARHEFVGPTMCHHVLHTLNFSLFILVSPASNMKYVSSYPGFTACNGIVTEGFGERLTGYFGTDIVGPCAPVVLTFLEDTGVLCAGEEVLHVVVA